ncbi:hypothetical protein BU23DRAFT_583905 [Bimuria novae-zelandiae CBS 107.79]|uniref:Uncharacterized protein n=1 Tax=Bimuria novae-zelandiae CBS 107.79 TaxID=1447943 RepID=A0A6A5UWX3_9PLEO|nr:hypothetical protein BU23DRAFT_583905 [Bimuria novae-zelandiae CBS 107.79]
MASPAPRTSNLTALLQSAPTAGDPTLVRDSTQALSKLRQLNEAEVITMFTPFVPHPPGTSLAKDMDPFEPLGRALPRQVRHVPYRLDHGMTETHADFLPASGAIVVVICSSQNVLNHDSSAFERQAHFAQDITKRVAENRSLANVPIVLLLVSNGSAKQAHEHGVQDFPTLVTLNDYSTAALTNAVRVLFGK